MTTTAASKLTMQPFTAAALERLSEVERHARLSVIGVRHMKRTRQMKWDGRDMDRGHEIASTAYEVSLADIERVGAQLRARWAA